MGDAEKPDKQEKGKTEIINFLKTFLTWWGIFIMVYFFVCIFISGRGRGVIAFLSFTAFLLTIIEITALITLYLILKIEEY